MKIANYDVQIVWPSAPIALTPQRVTALALALIALVGLLFAYNRGVFSRSVKQEEPQPIITDIFNRVINAENPSRPKLVEGEDYTALQARRQELAPESQNQLFYAELLSICNEEGHLVDRSEDKLNQFMRVFLQPPADGWNPEVKLTYQSILTEHLSARYGINYDAHRQMESVLVKGQRLTVSVVQDNGDCLFNTIIDGNTGAEQLTVVGLRQLASRKLLEAIEQNDEGLIYQLAEGMRMHREARGGAVTDELIDQTITLLGLDQAKLHFPQNPQLQACRTREEFLQEWRRQNVPQEEVQDNRALAQEYCKMLPTLGLIYPGEETVKVLAEELKVPMVIVHGESLRGFGPINADTLPILIYKTPGNAHYNRLVIVQEQWQQLMPSFQ